jgi:putative DNA primase/helicase
MIDTDTIALARDVRIEDEIARRGIRLRGKIDRCGPCPVCAGTDRFSINVRKQVFNCRGCNKGGDVIAMVEHLDGCSFAEAVRILAGIDPDRPAPKPDPVKVAEAQAKAEAQARDEIADARRRMMRAGSIWQQAGPIEETLAEHYLRVVRKLDVPEGVSGRVLRFHPACPFGTATYPCLVALVRSIISDKPQAIHRTALNPDGTALKIDGKTARKALAPIGGGAIKLTDNAEVATSLTVGEGLETVLAGMMPPLWSRPAWSLIDKGNIAGFQVLAGIESLRILVDHDRPDRQGRRGGQAAAIECAQQWDAAGREVIPIISRHEGDDIADAVRTAPIPGHKPTNS